MFKSALDGVRVMCGFRLKNEEEEGIISKRKGGRNY